MSIGLSITRSPEPKVISITHWLGKKIPEIEAGDLRSPEDLGRCLNLFWESYDIMIKHEKVFP